MALLELYTERNLLNAMGTYLGAKLLGAGYFVYYLTADAVQSPTAWYPSWSTRSTTYTTDPTFAAALAATAGLVTLHDGETAFPRFLARPTNEGAVGSQAEVQVPVFGVSVDPDVPLREYEVGSRLWWRARAFHLDGRARDKGEMQALAESLSQWFDEEVVLDVVDADGLSGEAPGTVQVKRRSVDRSVVPDAQDPDRFQLELHARLEYVA
jgi:hypothetical protein